MNSAPRPLASSPFRRFSVNAALQIASQLLPLVAGAVSIPLIYRNIAHPDFGVFTVALSMLGLFSLLDLGLGRATVRFLSRAFAAGDIAEATSVVCHSSMLLGAFSCASCMIFILAIPLVSGHWFQASSVSEATLRTSLYLLAAALPLAGMTSVFRAVLESQEKFLIISIIQVILGVSTYIVPLLASLITRDVRWLIAGAVACRCLAFIGFLLGAIALWQGPLQWHLAKIRGQTDFQSFSLWLVISNLVGSLIVYGDRAILVRMFGLSQIAFYNIPLEMLGRMMIIVNSAATVIFPALSRAATDDPRFKQLYLPLTAVLGAVMGVAFLGVSMLTPFALGLWLGEEFRQHSTLLIQVLLIGLAFQTLNVFALATLNARGVARPITIMHLLEIGFYFGALYLCGKHFGLTGVACVWSARLLFEYVCFTGFQLFLDQTGNSARLLLGSAVVGSNVTPLVLYAALGNGPLAIAVSAVCLAVSLLWARAEFSVKSEKCSK